MHRSAVGSLTHWRRVTHICIGNQTIIASDNGLSPDRHQAIICTIAVILLIEPLGTKFSEILIEIHTLSFKKMQLKMSSEKWPFCLGLNVLKGLSSFYWFIDWVPLIIISIFIIGEFVVASTTVVRDAMETMWRSGSTRVFTCSLYTFHINKFLFPAGL